MALEAVVFPQDLFGHCSKAETCNFAVRENWSHYDDSGKGKEEEKFMGCFDFLENQTENSVLYGVDHWNSFPPSSTMAASTQSCSSEANNNSGLAPTAEPFMPAKRRRSRSKKNKEDIENQRMTHIAVERNRRKQMNAYLSILRSLMPQPYVQRGDQASIVGGAIKFVKELEQHLQVLSARKERKGKSEGDVSPVCFSGFFVFPQYSTSPIHEYDCSSTVSLNKASCDDHEQPPRGVADIEVTMVESHANLKIRTERRPKQLLNLASGLHGIRLSILHLNVITSHQIALYSLCLKVEDDCKLTSVEEIAAATHQILVRIQEETMPKF